VFAGVTGLRHFTIPTFYVLNFGHLFFGFVSDFDIRISNFLSENR
jgi:hypothetical protein